MPNRGQSCCLTRLALQLFLSAAALGTGTGRPGAAATDIWVLSCAPFTGGLWDAGESVRVAGDMMARLINDDGSLLPGFRLGILWQDERCSGRRFMDLLMDNVLKDTYYVYPSLPHTDKDGDGRISTEETLDRESVLLNVTPRPLGLLANGCSGAASAVARWAYSLQLPMISGTNTDPFLSDRSLYPNYFRVVSHEGRIPVVIYATVRMLGIARATILVSESTRLAQLQRHVRASDEAGVSLAGRDLGDQAPGLRGVMLAPSTPGAAWGKALEAVRVLRSTGVRMVASVAHLVELHLILCAQVQERFLGLIYFLEAFNPNLWLSDNFNELSLAQGCRSAEVLGAANGLVMLQASIWRQDLESRLTCSPRTSVGSFRRDYFLSQGAAVGQHSRVPGNYTIMLEAASAADAVCMYALMLRDLLLLRNFSLSDLAGRKPEAYLAAVDALSRSHFSGLQGSIAFAPGEADSTLSRLAVYQLQAALSPCAGAGHCGEPQAAQARHVAIHEGQDFHFVREAGVGLRFHFANETFALPAEGETTLASPVPDFEECPIGELFDPLSRRCEGCAPGRVFVAGQGACVCAAGQRRSSYATCEACAPGRFSATADSATCEDCARGSSAGSPGSSECSPCVVGTYSSMAGSAACTPCVVGGADSGLWATMRSVGMNSDRQWNYAEGATSSDFCGCSKDARSREGSCVRCEEGLRCLGMDDVLVLPGFYSGVNISVYSCRGDAGRCPGGRPGQSCNQGRVGIGCAECEAGKASSRNGACRPCGDLDFVSIGLAVAAGIVLLTLTYFLSGRQSSRNDEMLTLMAFFGLLFTAVQVISVVGTFRLIWRKPLRAALQWLSFVGSLDLEILELGCLGIPPVGRFVVKVATIFAACLWLALVHLVRFLTGVRGRGRTKAVFGTVLMTFYITVVSAVLTPLQCEEHPNGMLTVREFPSVSCWSSKEHLVLVVTGICTFACIAVPHMVRCIVVVRQFPSRMKSADSLFLQENAFLFFRFRPEAYWYSLFIASRSLVCAGLKVVPSVVLQLPLLQFVMSASLLAALHFQPWRSPLANVLEASISLLIGGFCVLSSFFAETSEAEQVALSYVLTVMIVVVVTPLLLYPLAVTVRRVLPQIRKKRFQYFLCHHKAGAGAFTRLLKQTLLEAPGVTREVFVDVDNLESLTTLFNTVASDTETLFIVASHDIFRRPWCVGEMTMARWRGLRTLILQMPDMELPSETFIESYREKALDLKALTEEDISLEEVQTTLHWVGGLQRVELQLPLARRSLYDAAAQLCGTESWLPAARLTAPVHEDFVLCDNEHLEAVASAYVLQKLMVPSMLRDGRTAPKVLEAGAELPAGAKNLIVLLSSQILRQDWPLETLRRAAEFQIHVQPVILEESLRFPGPKEMEDLRILKGEQVADAVVQTLKEIAVPFHPQHAAQDALQFGADEVARRLSGPVGSISSTLKTSAASFAQAPADFLRRVGGTSTDLMAPVDFLRRSEQLLQRGLTQGLSQVTATKSELRSGFEKFESGHGSPSPYSCDVTTCRTSADI